MAKYKKTFEVNRKIIDKQLGDGKSYTGYVPGSSVVKNSIIY